MLKMLLSLLNPTPQPRHEQDVRDQTHEATNDVQRILLEYKVSNRHVRSKLIRKLDNSDQYLSSVADKIAKAAGK